MGCHDLQLFPLNVRGLSNFKKRRSIFAWCRKQNGNVIFLQETHSTSDEKQWKVARGTALELAHWSSNSKGVTILLQNSLSNIKFSDQCQLLGTGPYIKITLKYNKNPHT